MQKNRAENQGIQSADGAFLNMDNDIRLFNGNYLVLSRNRIQNAIGDRERMLF